MDLSLLDYRRRVADSYHRVRSADDPTAAWRRWVNDRDHLFATHVQSPVLDRDGFDGLPMFDHDPSWRMVGTFTAAAAPTGGTSDDPQDVTHSGDGATPFTTLGTVRFERDGRSHHLEVLWLAGYGGGVFLPFRDVTNGGDTYGGGRYLLDTVKGADLGHDDDRVVLDFNFAYHPSCVHDDRWSCPLAPPTNSLDVPVTAGEQHRA